jgi:hypothetical protein
MPYKLGKIFELYCSETGDAMNQPVRIEPLILTLRGQKVILDADLAGLYGVQTKVLNQAVKRNADRFPEDLMFQLTVQEWLNLKSQFVTSSLQPAADEEIDSLRSQFATLNKGESDAANRSQFATGSSEHVETEQDKINRSQTVTGSQKHRDPRFLPRAFTEHGALMAAMVLNSPEAVAMSLFVIRAFVRMREQLVANAAILKRLAEIDKTLLEHDQALGLIWEQLQPLLAPPPELPKRRIGFHQD